MVSFVQRSTRLKDRQQRTWDELAPRFVIEPPRVVSKTSVQPEFLFDAAATFGRQAPLVVEIGSGQGEAVAHAAEQRPDTDFLAVEVYTQGVAQTLQRIRQRDLTNIRIVQANAVEVLTTMLPAACADELWLFFPDPWHKSKHTKRRIVTPSFMDLPARVLRPGGVWRLATDWADYARQMREVIGADERFTADLHAPRFEGRVLTSFERKGLDKDRDIADITAVLSAGV
nr:tRNA (guanosine(46)-N7)-methyltransferase TrmB [Sanguibacter gelidistatuariae]